MAEERFPKNSSQWLQIDERLLFGVLIGAALLGFFILDLFGSSFFIQAVKVFLFLVFLVVLYFLWTGSDESEEQDSAEEPGGTKSGFNSLIESPEFTNIFDEEEKFSFINELTQFFENLNRMVRSTFVAHSSIIFLAGKDQDQLRVEFCDSESKLIHRGDLVQTQGTLPGSVFVNRTAVLEQNIPDAGQPANYYGDSVEIKSFLGVPITIKGNVHGVLAVDSLVANDFSQDDLNLLKLYEGLISQGIQLLGEREKSQLINQYIKAQRILITDINEDLSYENVYSSFASACRAIYQFDRLTITTVDSKDEEMAVIVKVIGQRDAMNEGFRFPLSDGITGWVIRKNKPLLLGDLEKGDLFRPRYSRIDKSNYGLRSFLGIPVNFKNHTFGAITLESKQPDFYSEWDQNILMLLTKNMGLALLSLQLLPAKIRE